MHVNYKYIINTVLNQTLHVMHKITCQENQCEKDYALK